MNFPSEFCGLHCTLGAAGTRWLCSSSLLLAFPSSSSGFLSPGSRGKKEGPHSSAKMYCSTISIFFCSNPLAKWPFPPSLSNSFWLTFSRIFTWAVYQGSGIQVRGLEVGGGLRREAYPGRFPCGTPPVPSPPAESLIHPSFLAYPSNCLILCFSSIIRLSALDLMDPKCLRIYPRLRLS